MSQPTGTDPVRRTPPTNPNPEREAYPLPRGKPALLNSDPNNVRAHFVPSIPGGTNPRGADLRTTPPLPNPQELVALVRQLERAGFRDARAGRRFVTARAPSAAYADALGLNLWRDGPPRVNGFDYAPEERPFVGAPEPRAEATRRAWAELGLGAVVFPPVVELCSSGSSPDFERLRAELNDWCKLRRMWDGGYTGCGVRAVLVDDWYDAGHPALRPFVEDGTLRGVPANGTPGTSHGTQSATVFKAVAPDAELTVLRGVEDASILDALQAAADLKPAPAVLLAPVQLLIPDAPLAQLTPEQRVQLALFGQLLGDLRDVGSITLFASGNSDSAQPRPVSASHELAISVSGASPMPSGSAAESADTLRFPSVLYPAPDGTVGELAGPCGVHADDALLLLPIRGGGWVRNWGGSSMATAFAGAVAALLRQEFRADAPGEIRERLRRLISDPLSSWFQPNVPWPHW